MKKIAIAAAVSAALSAGVAQAYTVGTFSNGFVVPNVIHNGPSDTTTVGIIARQATAVYWTFFNQDSGHVTDGCFAMTANDFHPFVWANEAGVGLEGQRGYLLFAASSDTVCNSGGPLATGNVVAANAFQVNTAAQDVAFVPVIDGPLTIAPGAGLTTLDANSLTSIAGAANGNQTMYMRYFIDGKAGGDDTRIVVWSTGGQKGTHTVNIYNDAQQRKSVNFELTHDELDWFDPEAIVGRPADYTDGFIVWDASTSAIGTSGSVFTYSVISSPAFGAVQTLLGAHN